MSDESKEPPGGLWAFHEGAFYALIFTRENRHMDHVTWFLQLGLPDYGPEFDRILRGRMIWDWVYQNYVLSYYGVRMLPNNVYERVNTFFNSKGHEVVERPTIDAADQWM